MVKGLSGLSTKKTWKELIFGFPKQALDVTDASLLWDRPGCHNSELGGGDQGGGVPAPGQAGDLTTPQLGHPNAGRLAKIEHAN